MFHKIILYYICDDLITLLILNSLYTNSHTIVCILFIDEYTIRIKYADNKKKKKKKNRCLYDKFETGLYTMDIKYYISNIFI